jgi:transcriptional regulator with AAA-type ATPase domain
VEKKGNIGELKNTVDRVLHGGHPSRVDPAGLRPA